MASRLEGLTRILSCTILLSDDLVRTARSEANAAESLLRGFEPIEPQRLRNRGEHVAVWSSTDRVTAALAR